MIRFTPRMKKSIVQAHLEGRDVSEQLAKHQIGVDEFDQWLTGFKVDGFNGLKTTKMQQYRGGVGA